MPVHATTPLDLSPDVCLRDPKPYLALPVQEPCHKLAWTLDACCKDQNLDERRLKELSAFFAAFKGSHHHKAHKRAREWETETGSRANSDSDDPARVLAEAGMVLREPCTLHLIVHQVILEFAVGHTPGRLV